MNAIRTAGVAYQPQTTSVAFTEPPLSPPVARPFAAAPAPAPVPVAQVAPVPQPEPPAAPQVAAPQQPVQAVQAAPTPVASTQHESVAIFVRLSSGERIWAGRFESDALAEQRAVEIVRALNRPEPGVWAKFGNRLIRPDAVVSIELAPRRDD